MEQKKSKMMERLKVVFVSSPYRGRRFLNLRYARKCCKYILSHYIDIFPFAPHLLLPQFTRNEEIAEILIEGIMNLIDEVWVFRDRGISEGMKREILLARLLGIPIRYFSLKEKS